MRHGVNNRPIAAGREHGYHGPMLVLEWIPVLLLAAVILTNLAERLAVPYPSLLAIAGAGLAFLPFAPQIRIEPELALALFVLHSGGRQPKRARCLSRQGLFVGGRTGRWRRNQKGD